MIARETPVKTQTLCNSNYFSKTPEKLVSHKSSTLFTSAYKLNYKYNMGNQSSLFPSSCSSPSPQQQLLLRHKTKKMMKKENPKDSSFIFSLLKPLPKLAFSLFLFFSLFFTLYSLNSLYSRSSSCDSPARLTHLGPGPLEHQEKPTGLQHIVFGVGAAARHWARRKDYVKLWWRPNETRGYVWLDKRVNISNTENLEEYPVLKISRNTNRFGYTNRKGSRSALRMTRIVSEMVRMNLTDVRWFVMCDDDTVFFPDNLVRVLRKYDHNKMYYIGSNSETHLQNIHFSYAMAYGGGGFAISYPLAKAIEKMQDRCIERYTGLYGSDDRVQACLSELGVPLTKEPGFHQYDVYGNLFGLLAAHPVAPIVTMHHLDILEPIFPSVDRLQALRQLKEPLELDSAGLMQQSICYDTARNWTISISWGFAVQIIRGVITPREMEQPARTFLNWYKRDDTAGFSFNTRPFSQHPCQKPYIYYLSNAELNPTTNVTTSEYAMHHMPHPLCWWKVENPEKITRVDVYKMPNPHRWEEPPRRDCCRVLPTEQDGTVAIDVGECREGEVMEPPLL